MQRTVSPYPYATYEQGEDPYTTTARRKRITVFVVFAHAAVIFIPLVYLICKEYFSPIEPVAPAVQVKLVEIPKGDSLKVAPDSKAGEVNNIPDPIPYIEPVKPDVKPKPKPEVKPEVKPKPKPEAKQEVKPDKKAIVKPPEKPKTGGLLTADQIKVNRDVVNKGTATKPDNKAQNKNTSGKTNDKALADIKNLMSGSGAKQTFGDPTSSSVAGEKYLGELKAYIESRWQQPALGDSGRPSVTIELTIDAKGRVTAKRIIAKSSFGALNASAESLLASLKTVPVPPKAMTVPVTLQIK